MNIEFDICIDKDGVLFFNTPDRKKMKRTQMTRKAFIVSRCDHCPHFFDLYEECTDTLKRRIDRDPRDNFSHPSRRIVH